MRANCLRLATIASLATAGGCQAPTLRAPTIFELRAGSSDGDLAAEVKRHLVAARGNGQTLMVYVGASWCEPCERFVHAAREHKLDQALAGLTLIKFDADRDGARLAAAGYVANMIPLFAIPADNGRASGRQHAGAIKGDGAIGFLVAKLTALTKAPQTR